MSEHAAQGSAELAQTEQTGSGRSEQGSTAVGAGAKRDDGASETMLARMAGPSDLKAGVGGYKTAEEVQRIIYDASKGSKYFNDQQRRDQELEVKSKRLQARLEQALAEARGDEEDRVDRILEQLEEKRDLSRVIALIDADAFYAACHQREDPSLEGKAFGVGGGMLTTASYEARKYGCRSAMPLYLAQKLCPHLISLKLQPELYTKASKEIMTVLAKYGPIAPASLDEAYVDLTQYCTDEGVSPAEAISRLRAEVRETTSLTVSAGVSPNKALSKIAADINKPDGQFVVDSTAEACMEFIKDVRLRRCYGIGRVSEVLLNAIGFQKVGDLFTDRKKLYLVRDHLGNKDTFRWLLGLYLGLGSNRVVRAKRGDRKTYGVEKTFNATDNVDALEDILRRIAKALHKDLTRAEFSGRTITLSIKHENYERVTRALTPGKGIWISSYKDIIEYGLRLLRKEQEDRRTALARGEKVKGGKNSMLKPRLLGLRVGNLRDDREVKKENKLDGFFTRTASPSKKHSSELALLSDSDDSDLAHSDNESDIEGDENPQKRALEQLKQDAAAADPFFAEDECEEMGAAGGGATSGRWMCVDEDIIVEEGREPAAGPSRPHLPPAPLSRRTSSSSSSATVTSSSSRTHKRPSPSFASHDAFSSALAATDSDDSSAAKKKQKKGGPAPPPDPPRPAGFTCPICAKQFQGSEAAMGGHVEKCLKAFDKPSKASSGKKKPSRAGSSSSSVSLFGFGGATKKRKG
ncbi:hypothetical protein JCM10213_004107 [Rhodosporidiobolus nylandii]